MLELVCQWWDLYAAAAAVRFEATHHAWLQVCLFVLIVHPIAVQGQILINEWLIVLLRQLSYALKNQLKAPKAPH